MIRTKLSPRSLTGWGCAQLLFDLELFFGKGHQIRNNNGLTDQN